MSLQARIRSSPVASRQVIQLEMEKLSVGRSAAVDRHARERLAALETQLGTLKREQGVSDG